MHAVFIRYLIMALIVPILLCVFVGQSLSYTTRREAPYYVGPNDPYSVDVNTNYLQEPAQRLFWDKWGNQGSNQVGGSGLWSMFTNKFPFLNNMFGRLEAGQPSTQYGLPGYQPSVYNTPQQYYPQQYQPQQYQPQQYQPQQYQPQQYYPQQIPYFQNFVPGRNVGFTDDAVIVTPPQVPVFPPASIPAPAPAPIPSPEPSPGYNYNKPQYKFELPHK